MKPHSSTGNRFTQFFGYLIVCNSQGNILGISENFSSITTGSLQGLLSTSVFEFFKKQLKLSAKALLAIEAIFLERSDKKILQQELFGIKHYLHIFRHEHRIYFEWEAKEKSYTKNFQMDTISFLLQEKTKSIWSEICTSIRNIIKFDRILLFKMEDSGIGKMLAECTAPNQESFLGKQFSEDFMPLEAINFYHTSPFRYSPNIHKQNVKLLATEEDIDIFPCQSSTLPELHIKYLKSIRVVSVIIIPIVIDGKFWGMLIGHCYKEKIIDFQKRQLCAFILQHAVNKYEGRLKQNLLEYHDKIKDIELDLKGKLLSTQSINCVLVQNMETLCKVPEADGLAIFHGGDIFTHGHCPNHEQIEEIVQIVNSTNKKPVFKDSNFTYTRGKSINPPLPFAGLLALEIANRNDYYVLWFREESISQIYQIKPNKDRNLLTASEETFRNSAKPWNDNDLYFVNRLSKLLHETIVSNSKEQEKFNEELIKLNNELEILTFTLSHDLKNPLAIIKLGTQIIHKSFGEEAVEKQKWTRNILDGIQSMETIIDGLIHLIHSKSYKFSKGPVPMVHMIRQITDEAKLLYNCKRTNIQFGKLLPIWGEKSLVYQVFLNVIGNAIKYSSIHESPVIKITSNQENGYINYEIEDNGVGIPGESLKNIFNVFTRATNTSKFPGSGVGLSLVKRIVEKLGGQIFVNSRVDNGTKVTLCFPYSGDIPTSIYTD
ncbi:ATP-binding protein [Pseudopedobacter saltans]|nr:ATP-binding protein [Pseudopedobacter saltans]